MNEFSEIFNQMNTDALNRQFSYVKSTIRNLVVDIEDGNLSEQEIVDVLKAMIGEENETI